jgi:hypothetical protein
MTTVCLIDTFAAVPPLPAGDPDRPLYAVLPVPGHASYFIGKDGDGHACLLVATTDRLARLQPPIRLESLDVQFELHCHLRKDKEPQREGIFTVIRCRSPDRETVRYFLSVCETILRIGGDQPAAREIAAAINRLAAIFQKMQKPPSRSVNGLFGELYLLWRSANPVRAVIAWRGDDTARFDFSDGDIRLDVKTASGRLRVHTFSYDQCNPPPGTIAVVASLLVERAFGGVALRSIIDEIAVRIGAHADLVFKLHEVVSATLGASLAEALSTRFDIKLADSSLRFFDMADVPAIRGSIPAGVSDIHFRSDLSAVAAVSAQTLIDRDPIFWDLLSRTDRA